MLSIKNIIFLDGATSSATSEEFYTTKSDIVSLEVAGDATSFTLQVEGQIDIEQGVWTPIAGIDLSTLTLITEISAQGLYEFSVEGLQKIRCHLISTNGTIKAFGRFRQEV